MTIKRQDIVDAIETRMKTILTTGGYQTNVGQRVSVWPTTPMAETALSELAIYDHDAEVMETGIIGQSRHELLVDIEVIIPGSDSRTDVRKALADINKALWSGLSLCSLKGTPRVLLSLLSRVSVVSALLNLSPSTETG